MEEDEHIKTCRARIYHNYNLPACAFHVSFWMFIFTLFYLSLYCPLGFSKTLMTVTIMAVTHHMPGTVHRTLHGMTYLALRKFF